MPPMSPSRPSSPSDMLLRWLDGRPPQSRCEWVIDPDRLADWHAPQVVDKTGRSWQRVLYAGDDLAFRRACRTVFADAEGAGKPVLLVVTRGSANPEPVDISHIGDVLGRAEGDPLDLSIVAFFKSIFPKVNPPQDALRNHKAEFLECVPGLHRAYGEFKHRWGEPDNWSRAQLLSMILLARHPEFRLDEVFCDDPDVLDFLVHACRLIMHPALAERDQPLVWQLMRESMLVKAADVEPWLGREPTDLAGYLVLRDFAESQQLQNPATQLTGKFSFRLDAEALEPMVMPVVRRLRRERDAWEQVNLRAGGFCRERACARVMDLLEPGPQALVKAVLDENTSPVLLRDILLRLLRGFLASPKLEDLAWVDGAASHPLLSGPGRTAVEQEGAAILECLIRLRRVEKRLLEPLPTEGSAEELLEWYCGSRAYFLELDASEAYQFAEAAADLAARELIEPYFHGAPGGLKRRVRAYLDALDGQLAGYISADPKALAMGSRSATRIIAETVAAHMPGGKGGRVWILIFDGMRFDTWSSVVRPLLTEHFETVEGRENAYFAVLPSRTSEARRSLLAGATAEGWKGPSGRTTTDERQLVARSLGLTELDLVDVRLLPEAQTSDSRRKLGARDSDAKRFNVLIYPISDDLAHLQGDTLAGINAKIKREILGDREQHLRGILEDLLMRVSPSDVVLVTSDHGFIELSSDSAVDFSAREVQTAGRKPEDAVQYRCLANMDREGLSDVVRLRWDDANRYVLAVGGAWFRREGGRSARYAHGGVSLDEMVVPGALFRRITERIALVEVEDLPQVVDIPEDQPTTIGFVVANIGNVDVDLEASVSTNLGEHLALQRRRLSAGAKERLEVEVTGRYTTDGAGAPLPDRTTRSMSIIIRHTDTAGKMAEPPNGRTVVPVSVIPKATKIETDALKGFDNL